MISLFKKTIDFFTGAGKENVRVNEIFERPKLEDFIPVHYGECMRESYIGVVTTLNNKDGVINRDIYFNFDQSGIDQEKLIIGTHVRGVVEKHNKNDAWRAVTVEVIGEDWNSESSFPRKEKYGNVNDTNNNEEEPLIVSKDRIVDSGIKDKSESNPQSFLLPDHDENNTNKLLNNDLIIIGKVTDVYQSAMTINMDKYIVLQENSCCFDVCVGDWIWCELELIPNNNDDDTKLCDDNQTKYLQAVKVVPLRNKRLIGKITRIYNTNCVINDEIYCSRKIVGKVPIRRGDEVDVEVIESDQCQYSWRTISLTVTLTSSLNVPTSRSYQDPTKTISLLSSSILLQGIEEEYITNKEGIIIIKEIKFNDVIIGDSAFVTVIIHNATGNVCHTLYDIQITSTQFESQLSIVSCSSGALGTCVPVSIPLGHKISVRLQCKGKFIGYSKEVCKFNFGYFEITRLLQVNVKDPLESSISLYNTGITKVYPTTRRNIPIVRLPQTDKVIRGERPYSAPLFIPVKLPRANVDDDLEEVVGDLVALLKYFPHVDEPLTSINYIKKLTTLLHLEEIEMNNHMRQFDVARINLTHHGEYLGLSVPGLCEKRPSVLMGDTVLLSHPFLDGDTISNGTDVIYEGCVHQVLHSQVLLKFHPSFHSNYQDEDYAVQFCFNRTPLRRCHFAISFVLKQLGTSVLFPLHLKTQLPQVTYVDPDISSNYKYTKQNQNSKVVIHPECNINKKELCNNNISTSDPIICEKYCKSGIDLNGNTLDGNQNTLCTSSNSNIKLEVQMKLETNLSSTSLRTSSLENVYINNKDSTSLNNQLSLQQNMGENKISCEHSNKHPGDLNNPKQYKILTNTTSNLQESITVNPRVNGVPNNLLIPRAVESLYYKELQKNSLSSYVRKDLIEVATVKSDQVTSVGRKRNINVSLISKPTINKIQDGYCVPVLPLYTSNGILAKSNISVLCWHNSLLNREQKIAVKRILEGTTRPLPYVLYGPPGTGKTITVVEAILQIFTHVSHSRILVVASSNSASDLLMIKLVTSDILTKADIVRLNAFQRNEDSVPECIKDYCCSSDDLRISIRQRVIVATATTAGFLYSLGLRNGHFTHLFVDEAGQLTEPETCVALGLVNSESGQVVLAGDPQQLGPVIMSNVAKKFGLQQSLLHRLCQSVLYKPHKNCHTGNMEYEPRLVTMLVKNYRSHCDIVNIPSYLFYDSALQCMADKQRMELLLSWPELLNPKCPLLFHSVISDNLQEGDSPSWFNPAEAFQVVRYAKSLITFGVPPCDIGIITPYKKQVQKMRQLLEVFNINTELKVGSVEEFQGQERAAIIISTVRSSINHLQTDLLHSLGFVKCPKRFNVAITRAQSLLVIVGNPVLLSQDNCWRTLIHFIVSREAYRGPCILDLQGEQTVG